LFESGDLEMEPVVVMLSRYEENAKWLSGHYEELKKRFKDEWIGVLNETVVDHDRELGKLVKRLRKKYSEAYNEIAVEYVTTKEIELIL
jgi:hypothetical protein